MEPRLELSYVCVPTWRGGSLAAHIVLRYRGATSDFPRSIPLPLGHTRSSPRPPWQGLARSPRSRKLPSCWWRCAVAARKVRTMGVMTPHLGLCYVFMLVCRGGSLAAHIVLLCPGAASDFLLSSGPLPVNTPRSALPMHPAVCSPLPRCDENRIALRASAARPPTPPAACRCTHTCLLPRVAHSRAVPPGPRSLQPMERPASPATRAPTLHPTLSKCLCAPGGRLTIEQTCLPWSL